MKGIAATVLRLLYVSDLQRWLLGIGLALTSFGIGAQVIGWHPGAQFLFAIAAIMGIVTTVISPVVVGPILFGSLASPRSIQLIPHGRLKMVLGAVCSQVLLALFIGTAVSALATFGPSHSHLSGAGTTCVLAFGGLTLFFLGFTLATQTRLGFVWVVLLLLIVPRVISFLFPHLEAGALLTSPKGLSMVMTASLLAWLLFGISRTRARHTGLPMWSTVGLGAFPKRASCPNSPTLRTAHHYTQREAVRILLGGMKIYRRIVRSVLVVGAVTIVLTIVTRSGRSGGYPFVWIVILCLLAGLLPGILAGTLMVRRTKPLWLAADMGRTELFTAIEAQSWRMILLATGAAMFVVVPLLAVGIHTHALNIKSFGILAVPLASGSAFIYVGLLCVRGNRIADHVIVAGNVLLLVAQTFSAAIESHALPTLICVQIILVPVLRQLGLRRWNNIDWLLIRQPLAAGRPA
jgi:hypothetical protein